MDDATQYNLALGLVGASIGAQGLLDLGTSSVSVAAALMVVGGFGTVALSAAGARRGDAPAFASGAGRWLAALAAVLAVVGTGLSLLP